MALLFRNTTCRFLYSQQNNTFYRRELPADLIGLSSHSGKRLFAQSLQEGYTESFFPLAQQFITQGLPSSCASASMAMVLNALRIDPQVQWKGIWRWYDDYNIPHLQPQQLNEGLTLTQFHQLALQNQARSMAFVSNDTGVVLENNEGLKISSLDFFRTAIASCSRREDMFLTVNFHRKSLKQTGTGHYSPIAAYNPQKDMALVLDVAKFKYDSYWCSIRDLYSALKPIDQTSGLPRGFLINKRQVQADSEARGAICSGGFDHSYNQLLKEILKKHQNVNQSIVQILNEAKMQQLLLSSLYDYATLQCPNKHLNIDNIDKDISISQIYSQLSPNAKQIISTFSKINSLDSLQFISLLLNKKTHPRLHFNSQPYSLLLRRCKLSLELHS